MKIFDQLSRRELRFDVILAVVVMVLGLGGEVELDADVGAYTRDPDALHVILIIAMTAPLALRRVYPVGTFAVILGAWVLDRGLDYPDSLAGFAVAVAFYTIGSQLSSRRAMRIGGAASVVVVGWTALGAVILESVHVGGVAWALISTVLPLLLGREMRGRRQRIAELHERAERAESEREEKARKAVEIERARIARELHDVVAHQMTVMTVQAEGAKRISKDADPRVVEALETISEAGHSALAEMRRTVGLLRQPGDESEVEPLPTLSDIDALVDRVRATGVDVDIEVTGDVRDLDEGTELSAYRIIQESLTNSVRHGGPDVKARVTLDYGKDSLDVRVVDDGRGATATTGDGNGHGLVGMRERVAVHGGEFSAGPGVEGGYRVQATIPVSA